jgi:hypothetical protein
VAICTHLFLGDTFSNFVGLMAVKFKLTGLGCIVHYIFSSNNRLLEEKGLNPRYRWNRCTFSLLLHKWTMSGCNSLITTSCNAQYLILSVLLYSCSNWSFSLTSSHWQIYPDLCNEIRQHSGLGLYMSDWP